MREKFRSGVFKGGAGGIIEASEMRNVRLSELVFHFRCRKKKRIVVVMGILYGKSWGMGGIDVKEEGGGGGVVRGGTWGKGGGRSCRTISEKRQRTMSWDYRGPSCLRGGKKFHGGG